MNNEQVRVTRRAVIAGPAPRPLPEQDITVENDAIRLG